MWAVSLRLTCMWAPSSSGRRSHVERRVAPSPGRPSRPWKRFQVTNRSVRSGIRRGSPLAPGTASVKIARRARTPHPRDGPPQPLRRGLLDRRGPGLRPARGVASSPSSCSGSGSACPSSSWPRGWPGASCRTRSRPCPAATTRSELGRPRHRAVPVQGQARWGHLAAPVPGGSYSPDILTKWSVYGLDFSGNAKLVDDPVQLHRGFPGVGFTHSLLFGVVLGAIIFLLEQEQDVDLLVRPRGLGARLLGHARLGRGDALLAAHRLAHAPGRVGVRGRGGPQAGRHRLLHVAGRGLGPAVGGLAGPPLAHAHRRVLLPRDRPARHVLAVAAHQGERRR